MMHLVQKLKIKKNKAFKLNSQLQKKVHSWFEFTIIIFGITKNDGTGK